MYPEGKLYYELQRFEIFPGSRSGALQCPARWRRAWIVEASKGVELRQRKSRYPLVKLSSKCTTRFFFGRMIAREDALRAVFRGR